VREVELVAAGSFLTKEPPEIRGTGYVVESLEAALWAFDRTDTFRDAVLAAANLGDDADTTAAICGQLAGAYYGASAIPDEWLEKLAMRERIEEMADALLDLSGIAADPEPPATTEPSPPAQ
jgi:ADP-ribosyl-[dinitrogen reductase] hydrolase